MTDRRKEQPPRARKEGLLIERLPDEVLVYDLDRKKAHCLNGSAALIWNHCDGKTSVAELTRILKNVTDGPVEEDVVLFALRQLGESQLLIERVVTSGEVAGLSRRQLIRRIGVAVSVPLVASILAPMASASLSCVGRNCVGQPGVCGVCSCNGTTCT